LLRQQSVAIETRWYHEHSQPFLVLGEGRAFSYAEETTPIVRDFQNIQEKSNDRAREEFAAQGI
jgi:hypothetical protein